MTTATVVTKIDYNNQEKIALLLSSYLWFCLSLTDADLHLLTTAEVTTHGPDHGPTRHVRFYLYHVSMIRPQGLEYIYLISLYRIH